MNILLAVDLRRQPEAVVDRARPWIVALGGTVDAFFADEYRVVLASSTGPDTSLELDRMTSTDPLRLRTLLGRLPVESRGAGICELGPAPVAIAAYAPRYDLVVVGTHGRTGLAHLWLGSVAERVVRASPRSVLVVRDQPPLPAPPRLLLAVDLDEDAAPLLRAVVPWAERLGAKVDLFNATQVPATSTYNRALDVMLIEHATALCLKKEDELARLRDAHLPPALWGDVFVDVGPPAPTIAGRGADYDLVVVGTHGRTGMARAVIGSVAEAVVRHSTRSVLVLRPR